MKHRGRRQNKNEQSMSDLGDNIKQPDIHEFGVL